MLGENWFSEICEECGTALSLRTVKKLHEEQTPYQKIEIYETTKYGNLMTIDGFVMLTSRDNFIYHEMLTHPALLTHPNPKRVVIIGGGDCGTLREVLKHASVEHVLQVEIDERVTRLAQIHFPELCASNADPRAEFYFGDGIAWMAAAPAGSVDLIIVDSTDPVGPAEGLFSVDFYRNCHRALASDGLIVQQSESPLIHLRLFLAMRNALLQANFTDAASVLFPQSTYPSGWWSATMAGKDLSLSQFRELPNELQTLYYTSDIHRGALAIPPYLRQAIETASNPA